MSHNENIKILVTGGCGFIGSNFIDKLFKYKVDLVVIDNLSTGLKKNLDILKAKAKRRKIKFDYIFHFAAYSSVKLSLENPNKVIKNNLISTKNLVFFTNKYKIRNFIFSSSASVYGNKKFKKNIKERSKLNPINAYGKSKLLCEQNIKIELEKKNSRYCIFRYFNVVGRHISNLVLKKKNLNLFDSIYFALKNRKIFFINGKNLKTIDGTPVRDFITINDIINAHLECLSQKKNNLFWNKIYNVGINKGLTVMQIINECNKIFNHKIKYKLINNNKGEIERSIADNSKFIKFSNWQPRFTKTNKIVKSFFK